MEPLSLRMLPGAGQHRSRDGYVAPVPHDVCQRSDINPLVLPSAAM